MKKQTAMPVNSTLEFVPWRAFNTSVEPKRECVLRSVGVQGMWTIHLYRPHSYVCYRPVSGHSCYRDFLTGLYFPPDYYLVGRQFLADKLPER